MKSGGEAGPKGRAAAVPSTNVRSPDDNGGSTRAESESESNPESESKSNPEGGSAGASRPAAPGSSPPVALTEAEAILEHEAEWPADLREQTRKCIAATRSTKKVSDSVWLDFLADAKRRCPAIDTRLDMARQYVHGEYAGTGRDEKYLLGMMEREHKRRLTSGHEVHRAGVICSFCSPIKAAGTTRRRGAGSPENFPAGPAPSRRLFPSLVGARLCREAEAACAAHQIPRQREEPRLVRRWRRRGVVDAVRVH